MSAHCVWDGSTIASLSNSVGYNICILFMIRFCRSSPRHAQWSKLVTYVDHGQARIDNNLVDQATRFCKLGAKNWLFEGSPKAGKTSAVIYSILQRCRRRSIEPMTYLTDVLKRLPSTTNIEAENLTSKNWRRSQVKTR
jgi:hypothetical protein